MEITMGIIRAYSWMDGLLVPCRLRFSWFPANLESLVAGSRPPRLFLVRLRGNGTFRSRMETKDGYFSFTFEGLLTPRAFRFILRMRTGVLNYFLAMILDENAVNALAVRLN